MTGNKTIWVSLRCCTVCALLIYFAATRSMAQQSTQFTQYMFNGLVINPAYAGADEALSLTFIQRNQWADVENAPTTQTLSAHTLFKKKHIGLGVSLINDKIGVHKNLSALTSYAYHLKVGRDSYFSMGLQAGILNKQSDYASLVNPAINDPKLNNPFISHTSVNFGMGFYFRNPKLHMGLSVPELIPAKVSINDSTRIQLSTANYFLFFKYRLHINQAVDFEPGALLKYTAGLPLSFDLNANLIFHRVLTMGLSYRRSESIDFLLRGQLTPQLQFGYSYDYPLGEITKLSSGSHELMVNYVFRYERNKVSSPR
jgi:type IX secretion system PorP/SprF family membrane protein